MDRENQKKTLAFLRDRMEQTNARYESAKEEYEHVKAAVNEIDSDRSKKILHSVRSGCASSPSKATNSR